MRLDLRTRLHGRPAGAPAAPWLLAAGLALAAWQALGAWQDAGQLARHREGLAGLRRAAVLPAGPALGAEDVRRHQAFEPVAAALATPWPQLLDLFEGLARHDVLLTRLHPEAETGRVEIGVSARGAAAAARWVEALARDGRLEDLRLQQHQRRTEQAGAPLELSLSAQWNRAPRPVPAASATVPPPSTPAPAASAPVSPSATPAPAVRAASSPRRPA